MKSTNYILIQGWMCNELELKGNDLLVYALIYGFSQDGESCFSGSRDYIANTFNISKPTVDKAIKNLLDKNYIYKYESEDNQAPNSYYVNIEVVKKLYWGSKETLLGGSKETLLNNTNINNTNKKDKVLSKDNTTENFEFGKKKKYKKQNLYTKCVSLIESKTDDEILRKLFKDWLNMLLEKYKDRGKQLYFNVFKSKLDMIDKFDRKHWKAVIEYNIQRGYEGFYPIPNYKKIERNYTLADESGDRNVPTMTEEDYEEEAKRIEEMEKKGIQCRF